MKNVVNKRLSKWFGCRIAKDKPQIVKVGDAGGMLYEKYVQESLEKLLVKVPMSRWLPSDHDLVPLEPSLLAIGVKRIAKVAGREERKKQLRTFIKRACAEENFLTALKRLKLSADDAPGLVDAPAWLNIHPWSEEAVDEVIEGQNRTFLNENRSHGLSLDAHGGGGACYAGVPIAEEKCEVEVERTVGLMQSVEKNGLVCREDHRANVSVDVLKKNDGEWGWIVRGGNHRVAVCYGMGVRSLEARVKRLVYECDADIWPGVRKGVFTRKGAGKYFGRLFGEPDDCL